jgi:hypothetical protein
MGDILEMAQALLIYWGFMTEVCCFCWFGDELTEEVTITNTINSILLLTQSLAYHHKCLY